MNANLKQITPPTINSWLLRATSQLSDAGVPSARLDAELLLAHSLKQSRTWLIAHQNDNITDVKALENASKLLTKRLQRVPVAYLTNHKEFYNRSFFVDESVLIPRPESEMIIDVIKSVLGTGKLIEMRPADSVAIEDSRVERVKPSTTLRILDIGTGSGCLGVTAKLEMPSLSVTVSDISDDALNVARKNARALGAKPIRFVQSDLLEHWLSHHSPKKFDIIMANLPYVNPEWQQSPETVHEPSLALYANDNGLELIKKCIQQASKITSVSGYLILEADPEQHAAIIATGTLHGFKKYRIDDYIVTLQRV